MFYIHVFLILSYKHHSFFNIEEQEIYITIMAYKERKLKISN